MLCRSWSGRDSSQNKEQPAGRSLRGLPQFSGDLPDPFCGPVPPHRILNVGHDMVFQRSERELLLSSPKKDLEQQRRCAVTGRMGSAYRSNEMPEREVGKIDQQMKVVYMRCLDLYQDRSPLKDGTACESSNQKVLHQNTAPTTLLTPFWYTGTPLTSLATGAISPLANAALLSPAVNPFRIANTLSTITASMPSLA